MKKMFVVSIFVGFCIASCNLRKCVSGDIRAIRPADYI